MQCPYLDCRKDYNDSWPKVFESWINPADWGGSIAESESTERIYLKSRRCRFCHRLFHEVYVGHNNYKDSWIEVEPTLELLVTYPVAKTKFEAMTVPKEIVDAFNEAERCRSVGSLTGSGGGLRKAIYALCDAQLVEGSDYREKISNLQVKDVYKELLKQIKWLGDNTTKPGEEKYTIDMVDVAIEILPILIDDIYLKDEKAHQATKLLAKARSFNTEEKQEYN